MPRSRSLAAGLVLLAVVVSAAEDHRRLGPQPGDVYREFAIHNDGNRWRVTDPEATAAGAKEFLPNPILKIELTDLQHAIRVEALLDRWGGHLRTTSKQIRFNGNRWHTIPEIETFPAGHQAERYYSQDNPVVPIPLADLHAGENTVEGTCGTLDNYNWGQWGLYSLIVRIYYSAERRPPLTGKIVHPEHGDTIPENPRIQVDVDGESGKRRRIDLLAWYDGYDENGDGVFLDWHGGNFQPNRGEPAELAHHVGTSTVAGAEITWNTEWVPDQPARSIRLVARVQAEDGTWFVTDVVRELSLRRTGSSVQLYRPAEVPERFGVRVGRSASCLIPIPVDANLGNATKVGLALRTWHGWDGHHSPLELNQHQMAIAGKNHHFDFDILDVPVEALRTGHNEFRIHSETKHHMLEVLWPGPALLVRYALGR
jgi:hypothetical protein